MLASVRTPVLVTSGRPLALAFFLLVASGCGGGDGKHRPSDAGPDGGDADAGWPDDGGLDAGDSGEAGPESMRAVCVVADFADAVLEDYVSDDEDVFDDVGAIRTRLDDMTAHWEWMSLGTRLVEWDIERIQLDENLAEDAFPGWPRFREAVVEKAHDAIDFDAYDADGDGVLDVMFVVASSQESEFDYLVGGTATVSDACTFVDGQASLSVRLGATGNFNHEVGHCLGLPDVYGANDTLGYLSLMSDSWPTPPFGFSAYDRLLLGWLDPIVVEDDRSGIELRPAERALDAALVRTTRDDEYFLVENRQKPASGYGSAGGAPDFDGLAIYHVFDLQRGSDGNRGIPPLIRVEPADGDLPLGSAPDTRDFWYPENPLMEDAFVGTSHYDGRPVVRVDGLVRTEEGIRFDVTVLDEGFDPASLLVNGDFEEGEGDAPSGWESSAWMPDGVSFGWEAGAGRDGSGSPRISVEPGSENDARWSQEVTGLTVGRSYVVLGWVRGESIEGDGAAVGANLSLGGTWTRSHADGLGSFDWTELGLVFTAEEETARVECRLGHNGSLVSGTAWFDDVSLVELVP